MKTFTQIFFIGICLFFFSCGLNSTNNTHENDSPSDSDNNSDYGVGPDVIPDGTSDVGSSALEDGSAARMALFGVPQYFWGSIGKGSSDVPLVRITHAISSKVVDIEVLFNPAFVDNTYGTGSIGWNPNRPHTFRDLHVSDHVQIAVLNKNGDSVWVGKLDLLSQTTKVSSGYACLGPFGGDGTIIKGDSAAVFSFGSSLDDNINYYGYHLFENSPATDSTYRQNADYPNWQFYVSYRITLDISIFGSSGYGQVMMTSVHASPGKNGTETITVKDGPTPQTANVPDPFRYYIPSKPVLPPDTTSEGGGGVD